MTVTDITLMFDVPDLPVKLQVCVYREDIQLTIDEAIEEARAIITQLGINPKDADFEGVKA
jgi:hypothetical protein